MKRKQWISSITVFALIALLIVGCSKGNNTPGPASPSVSPSTSASPSPSDSPSPSPSAQSKDGGTLTISTFSDIVSVNPIFINDTSSGDIEQLVFAKLYDLDRQSNLAVEPWSLAAELPKVSADNKTYTIKLKNTAKWSDGQPITADDVKFTFDTIRTEETGAPGISQYDKIESITKADDYTLDIKLKQVYAPFQFSLYSSILPAHILKDVPLKSLKEDKFGVDPARTVTSGPWMFSEWKQGQYITLNRNPNYWGETKPHIDKIIYKIYADQNTEVQALLKGDTQMTEAVPLMQIDAIKKKDNLQVILKPGPTYEFIQFNFKDENFPDKYSPFKGQKTRQAIAYAVNRQGMVDNVLKGSGGLMNSPFLPGSWADPGAEAVNYEYSADKAKALLAEDGWKPGKDGILVKDGHRFSFELQYNAGNSRREQVSTIIQDNLKDVGIEVKPKGIDFATWIDQNITPGKFPAILLAWSLNNPDPDGESIFSSKYFPPTGQNGGWYVNKKADDLWVKGQQVVDQAERAKIYHELGKELSIDLPYVFLYQYGLPQAYDASKLKWEENDRPESSMGYGYLFHAINWWVE
ncbi:peptide ABC transporter substrate-binding protein [Cohnella endophytica]|uniref:Peptide ABC transporter substrate-binding protein n=1 Tax=Cohnella endophytica TaxID=2419778 RepID=A0A494XGR0_9BACL|nr:ABC transporter substrate-binding protein [Cohnella endophytica]RKP49937.1 peptide ABC transporter substrate-binding protein [Cohnella endophytica]